MGIREAFLEKLVPYQVPNKSTDFLYIEIEVRRWVGKNQLGRRFRLKAWI